MQVGLQIGEGSFAQVHRGRNVVNGQDVAIKMVKSEEEMCLRDVGVSYEDVLKAMHSEVQTNLCFFKHFFSPLFLFFSSIASSHSPSFLRALLHDSDFFCPRLGEVVGAGWNTPARSKFSGQR